MILIYFKPDSRLVNGDSLPFLRLKNKNRPLLKNGRLFI